MNGSSYMFRHYIAIFKERSEIAMYYVTRHNTPIHNVLSNAQLSISLKELGTVPEDDNLMPKHVGATIHNK
jgi:hypothetical protein